MQTLETPLHCLHRDELTNVEIRHHPRQPYQEHRMKETAKGSERYLSRLKTQMRMSFSYLRQRRESETATAPTKHRRSTRKELVTRLDDRRQLLARVADFNGGYQLLFRFISASCVHSGSMCRGISRSRPGGLHFVTASPFKITLLLHANCRTTASFRHHIQGH